MPITDYDLSIIGKIVAGYGDWFTAKLIRLIAKADRYNRERLRLGFPSEVAAYEMWYTGDGRNDIRDIIAKTEGVENE